MSVADGFQFTDKRPRESDASLVVRVPFKVNRKRRLLAVFAGRLRFPNYFGWNWDAFEECLADLSWLAEVREVIVVHRDVPFADDAEQRTIYLSILRDRMPWSQERKLSVIFPPRCRQTVLNSLVQE